MVAQTIVGDADPTEREVARVGDDELEAKGAADRDERPRSHVGIDAVDELLEVDSRRGAEVVRRVEVADELVQRRHPAGDAHVGERTGIGRTGGRAGDGLVHVQRIDLRRASEVRDAGRRAQVDDGHVRQGGVAGVGHLVGPAHRAAYRDERPGRFVGILAVDELHDLDIPLHAEVMGRVGSGHGRTGRIDCVDRSGIHVLPGLDRPGEEAGEADAGRKLENSRTGGGAQDVVGGLPVDKRDVAGVGDFVGPGDGLADGQERARGRVGREQVCVLLDADIRSRAEVVRAVRVLKRCCRSPRPYRLPCPCSRIVRPRPFRSRYTSSCCHPAQEAGWRTGR